MALIILAALLYPSISSFLWPNPPSPIGQPQNPSQGVGAPSAACSGPGSFPCSGLCYQCPAGQSLICPADSSSPACARTLNQTALQQAIVYVRNDVTGCCDSASQISSVLGGSGSGVILASANGSGYAVTSRHVVDCVYAHTCAYPTNQTLAVQTSDGVIHTPSQVLYAPGNLDLAILVFAQNGSSLQAAPLFTGQPTVGEPVTALGYPATSLPSEYPILQFLQSNGTVTGTSSLLTFEGQSFTAIQSNALASRGSSGGGLFNQYGQLLGIITWGDTSSSGSTIAIGVDTLLGLLESSPSSFSSCPHGSYLPYGSTGCCPQGKIFNPSDSSCYPACGSPTGYCPAPQHCSAGQCYR